MKLIRLKYHISLPAAAVRHHPTGPRIMKASCLGQAEEGGNFTLLVRMNFSLTSPRCDTEVEYNRLFKMGAP